ncbi:beta-1,3-galactosyltransferase 1-like [Lytechinus variegatus]|uniref:beta-1,3-galactosyltransferase 1-like n=1 Tax=Lytechinus variegatus TaxID=7654 RepID=UPI001BB18DD5|nr:beta-1,3-galactosyltransferase 1-like [Lytechinus variegatus]
MALMRTFYRCGRGFTFATVFAVAFIITLNNIISYQPVDDYTRENSRDYSFGSTNDTKPQSIPFPDLAKKAQWFTMYALTDQQKAVENWKLSPDRHNYHYLHNPAHICADEAGPSDILLVIFVNSSPGNAGKRAYIRNTFGSYYEWPTHEGGASVMRVVFLLGAVKDTRLQADINLESDIYKDIVQESFIDDYLNLTRKTVMGMKWVTKYCRNAKYTMKVDDDIIINAPLVYTILQTASPTNFTLGTVLRKATPVRSPRGQYGKFLTPLTLYPHKVYPPYFNGHAYLLSTDVVENIYRVSMETDLFPWSDVFIGMCLNKLGIRLRHSSRFLSLKFPMATKTQLSEEGNALDEIREYVSVFHFTVPIMNQLWEIWTRDL